MVLNNITCIIAVFNHRMQPGTAPLPCCIHWSGRTDPVRTLQKEGSALQTDKPNPNGCGQNAGSLPGDCGALAFPYVPFQEKDPPRYSRTEALQTGTLFPGLNLPFKAAIAAAKNISNSALAELMALDFAIDELGLYLVTHADDQEALQLYWSYIKLAEEGRKKYQQMYGPLLQTDLTPEEGYAWLKDPWPWEKGGNS